MDDILPRREVARPRRVSAAAAAAAAAAEPAANVSLQDGEVNEVHSARESQPGPGRVGAAAAAAAGRMMERRNSLTQGSHQRHMPMEPLKLPIPRKTKEKRALFQDVSTESREHEDMMTILTSSYIDTTSAGCFTYSKPRLVHSEPLEKEFVEKRREMKSDGRTDKELEESYCFLLADTVKLPSLCEKGLFVGQSWMSVLGNPGKGVYLSRYSDLLHINSITPGTTGEILIFKVMKGKVKSIYENMKNVLDPTPRFDSHISKNASKVTSVNSYRAFELTQQYFYEYHFDELRQRPRQVCPYAVVSFHFKGKDSPLPSKPLVPIRLNSQSAEGNKERAQFTVWTGDLVKGDRVLFQISLRSFSPPFLPRKLPEKLEIGWLMRLDKVTKLLPSDLFSYNLYNSSQEVVKKGHCCSLLEVTDRSRSTTTVTRLLQELETNRVVLVTPLTDKGFLFLLSSVQMATADERGENWKRCLQALFVFPESRDVVKSTSGCASTSHDASESLMSGGMVMPRLSQFIPALHHALVKARANPSPELSAGVERQAREYLIGLNDGKVRPYPMDKYDSKVDERGKPLAPPKHHKLNMDRYLRSYLYSPHHYLLSVARAKLMVETHCGPEEQQETRFRRSCAGQREAAGKETTSWQTNTQKLQQVTDLVLTCKRNAENEVKREEGLGAVKAPGRKRRMEQESAERALKFLKASQEPGRHSKTPVEGIQVPSAPGSLASVIGSLGMKDVDLREDGSELAANLLSLLTGLNQAAKGATNQSLCEVQEEGLRESCPFDRLATKLGLPTNCDIDLRKQEELEDQTAGSVSSLEGFSPSSHSGEMNHHGRGGGGGGLLRRAVGYGEEEEEIPWVLIPITGLCSERYTQRDRNIPQDPRFQHLTTATGITTTTKPAKESPTPSPEPSPPPFPFQCPSPEPSPPASPSQCPSPDPSPPPSPSQCPSPEPSPPPSPSQCPSPELSPPPSPSRCPSPQPSPSPSPSRCPSLQLSDPRSRCQSPEPNEPFSFHKDHSGAKKEQLAPTASREFAGVSMDRREKTQGKEKNTEEPCISASVPPSLPPAPRKRTKHSPPPAERAKGGAEAEVQIIHVEEEEETVADEGKREDEVVEIMAVASDKERKGDAKEPLGGSLFSPSVSSSSRRNIDSIVDKHLGDFTSEMQVVLKEESVHYSFPQSAHPASNTDVAALQHAFPHTPISQFSQYVSFYNPCPPVQDYVSSLQDSINSMLTELTDGWPSHQPTTSRTNTDAALASKVSAFVSSIRANANTGPDDDGDGLCGEVTGADNAASPAHSRGGDAWPSHTNAKLPDATNHRKPPTPHVTLSVATSAPNSVYTLTNTLVLHPPPHSSPQSQSRTLELNRTVRQTQDNSSTRTEHFPTGVDGGSSLAGATELTLRGFRGAPEPSTEPSHPSELVSSPASLSVPGPGSGLGPPATALSSLISQLQPEVFNSLEEIIKDVKRNSLQFYLHSTEPEGQVYEEIKEHLLKQGNVEQSPLAFLDQENSDSRLLVIIKNKDIAGHVHKIPGLVSLKRHPTVVFVGIDTLDDIRNNSYNELFVSGGCIVSDELVLSPDYITHDQLAALLMFLEQHSSPESVWRWKVHYKTYKKLKEQARFKRDAANLLDLLSAYQKRQIVEFLPYHHCDMMNHQSPDLDCLMELQARYTQYRHTVFLTEHHFEKFPACGIIVASFREILHDFTRLIGYHDIKSKQPIMEDMLAPKEHIHSLSSCDRPQHHLQQSGSALPPHSHLSDQLVPDASCKEGVPQHSGKDFEDLRQAISQLRAERQAQLQLQQQQQQQQQRLDCQAELSISSLKGFLPTPPHAGSRQTTPPLGQGSPTELTQGTPGRKAVAATLELIHSALQPELGEEERRAVRAEGRRSEGSRGGGGGSGGSTPVRVAGLPGGNMDLSNSNTSIPSSIQSTAAVTGPSNHTDSTTDGKERADQQGELAFTKAAKHSAAYSSTIASSAAGNRSRDTHSGQEHHLAAGGVPPGSGTVGTASGAKVTGSAVMVTDQESSPNPAVPNAPQIQQHLLQLNECSPALLQHPPHSQQQRGAALLQPHHLPQIPNQPFSSNPLLQPLTALGGSLLGPPPVWAGGLGPTNAAALVWSFQQGGRDFTGSRLLGGYHNPAGQGSSRYRGGQRGGGFNGM